MRINSINNTYIRILSNRKVIAYFDLPVIFWNFDKQLKIKVISRIQLLEYFTG